MTDFAPVLERLRAQVRGDVLADELSLGLYATDASFYQIAPLAVVCPLDRNDALTAMKIAAEAGVAILPRGGGTSLAGQTINHAVVIDHSKYRNKLLEVNAEERWARVEPGIVRDELNALLAPHKLHFAPDPASGNRANVGGMIATNAAGMRSIRYGMTIDHLVWLDVALADGTVIRLENLNAAQMEKVCDERTRRGAIHRGVRAIVERERGEIAERFPKVRRRSGGYALDAFLDAESWPMPRLIAGSEGTLAMILEACVRLEPVHAYTGMVVAHFRSLRDALNSVGPIVAHAPSAVELIDEVIIGTARTNLMTRALCGFMEGEPKALLVIEDQGASREEVEPRLKKVSEELLAVGRAYACVPLMTPGEQNNVWTMRKNGEALMNTVPGDVKPIGFIEDAAVPLAALPDYIEDVLAICAKFGQRVSLYAHASVGLLHVRPMLNLHEAADREKMKRISEEVFARVIHYKGAMSGEHGDGIVRGGFNERFFGPRIYEAFKQIKALFDPRGLMNPGKILATPPMDSNQRFMPGYAWRKASTMFHYREEGGFRVAVEDCTGIGVCRQTLLGTMCPSYRATRDEEHSTRGRANALRLAMTGQLHGAGGEGLANDRLHEALDLCLSCKACKSECPNNVDMAKLKSEALHVRHLVRGAGLRERIFSNPAGMAKYAAGPLAPVVNAAMNSKIARWAMGHALGVAPERELPEYARERLSVWFARRGSSDDRSHANDHQRRGAKPCVALFCDTYIEHHEPKVGRAAIEVLEAAGFDVELARVGCCQRPAISKGFLERARREGGATLRGLDAIAARGVPIVVIEPSCASALVDDLPDLIEDEALGRRVAKAVLPIEQFLEAELAAGRAKLELRDSKNSGAGSVVFHGHCHQKALFGTGAARALMARIPGADVRELATGCCGMAGSFGYEREHYALSQAVAEDRLFPALRSAPKDAAIAACGFSCRHQIASGGFGEAKHPLEILHASLDSPWR